MTPEEIDRFNQLRYQEYCTVAHVSIEEDADPSDYFTKLVQERYKYLKTYCIGKKVLDIGCGRGDYLFEIKDLIQQGHGIDFTDKAIQAAISKKDVLNAFHLHFIKANARYLPFEDASFDFIFSFSALAYMPKLEEVCAEIARVLKNGGVAVLEIGNINSLNTVVCQAYPELAKTCHVSIPVIKKILTSLHLDIIDHKAFGVLPFWGKRPLWLRFFLLPFWKKIFQYQVKGQMLDAWVSNSFIFKHSAYRHFVFLKKSDF